MEDFTPNTSADASTGKDGIVVEAKTPERLIRVLIVDDIPVVRQGVSMYLSLNKDLELVGKAENGAIAVDKAAELNPDVVLMDLLMPEMDGGTATMRIKTRFPHIEVLAFTVVHNERLIQALWAGATGFVNKGTVANRLNEAISAVARGEPYIDPDFGDAFHCHKSVAPDRELTLRERAIWRMLAMGRSDETIQQKLRMSPKSFVIQADSLRNKLGCRGRLELTQSALRHGLITLDEIDLDVAIYSVTTATPKTGAAAEAA